jgi:hypothetical protein
VKGRVLEAVKRIKPSPKVMGVGKTMVLIGGGGEGGRIPPLVVSIMGVQGIPNEVATFYSIAARWIK